MTAWGLPDRDRTRSRRPSTIQWVGGVYITNFVFWVGIAHSGTLISAVLFLFRAKFRNSFNRSAEAMTVIAIATAGLFPLVHLGRVWVFYFLMPYPNQRQLWGEFSLTAIVGRIRHYHLYDHQQRFFSTSD